MTCSEEESFTKSCAADPDSCVVKQSVRVRTAEVETACSGEAGLRGIVVAKNTAGWLHTEGRE
jgi:hypothetical protein